jgi:hypothetical protein
MRDAELISLFRTLEEGVAHAEPEPAFADDLYRRLRTEVRRARPGRAVLLAVAAILVTGLIGGALVLGSGIVPIPGPSESPTPSEDTAASESPEPSAAATQADGSRWYPTGEPAGNWRLIGEGFTVTLLSDGRVLLVGNVHVPDEAAAPITELYDPAAGAGTWTSTPGGILQPRNNHTATLLEDGRVLIVGGRLHTDHPPGIREATLDSAELFDPATGQWTATGSLGTAREDHTATLLRSGRVLVMGGLTGGSAFGDGTVTNTAEIYDPRTGRWSAAVDMPYPLAGHTATLLGNSHVLVVGDDATRDVLILDPVSQVWAPASPMTQRLDSSVAFAKNLAWHTATLLADGRVLVAGGGWPTSPLADIYDPGSGQWTATGSMNVGRFGFTSALLSDGRVLVAGSGDGGYGGDHTAEIFDPETGTWTRTTDMGRERGFHEGTRLADGRVLVVEGYGGEEPWAEVYEPGGF